MFKIIKNAMTEKGLEGKFVTSYGNKLNVYIPNEELKYKLENDDIPILMQEMPGLIQLAKFVYEMEMSLIQVKSQEDVVLYAIGIIYGFLRNKGYGYIDIELFFKLLEDFLIIFMDAKNIEYTIYQASRKDRKLMKLEKFNYLKNIYNLFDNLSMFKILSIVNKMEVRNSEIGMMQVEKIINAINFYENNKK